MYTTQTIFVLLSVPNYYNSIGIHMLTLLVPILINYLLEEDKLQRGTRWQINLHQQSFQWLNKIGPKYPQVS